jgi:hypothetical protein
LTDVSRRAVEASEGVQRALAVVSRGGEEASGLIDAFWELDSLIEGLGRPALRPRVNEQRAKLRSLQRLRDGWEEFLGIMTAVTPEEAQRLRDAGQSHIDAAAWELDQYSELMPLYDAFQNSGSAVALALLGLDARAIAGGAQRFAGIDAALRSHYGYPDLGAGFGVQAHLITTVAALYLDIERFQVIVETLSRQLDDNPEISTLLSSSEWQEEYARSAAVMGGAVRVLDEMTGLPPLMVVDRFLAVVPRCRDGILRLGLATVKAANGSELLKELHGSVGGLFAKAQPNLHLDDTLKILRDGAAHQDFTVENEHVVVRHKGALHRYAPEEFLDRVLSVIEVALAFNLALLLASARCGVQASIMSHLGADDLRDIVSYLSGLVGLEGPVVRLENRTIFVHAVGTAPEPVPYFGAISAVAGRWASAVNLKLTNGDEVTGMSCALSRYVALQNRGAVEVQDVLVDMAGVAAVTTINGRCLWQTDQWKAIAYAVRKELDDVGLAETIKRLRRLRGYIQEVGISEAVEFCTDLIRSTRTGGEQPSPGFAVRPMPVQALATRRLLDDAN